MSRSSFSLLVCGRGLGRASARAQIVLLCASPLCSQPAQRWISRSECIRHDRFSYFRFRRPPRTAFRLAGPTSAKLGEISSGCSWDKSRTCGARRQIKHSIVESVLKVGKRTLEDKRSSGRQVRADLTELIPINIETWRLWIEGRWLAVYVSEGAGLEGDNCGEGRRYVEVGAQLTTAQLEKQHCSSLGARAAGQGRNVIK